MPEKKIKNWNSGGKRMDVVWKTKKTKKDTNDNNCN